MRLHVECTDCGAWLTSSDDTDVKQFCLTHYRVVIDGGVNMAEHASINWNTCGGILITAEDTR